MEPKEKATDSYGTQGKKLQIVMEPKEKATDSYGTQGKSHR